MNETLGHAWIITLQRHMQLLPVNQEQQNAFLKQVPKTWHTFFQIEMDTSHALHQLVNAHRSLVFALQDFGWQTPKEIVNGLGGSLDSIALFLVSTNPEFVCWNCFLRLVLFCRHQRGFTVWPSDVSSTATFQPSVFWTPFDELPDSELQLICANLTFLLSSTSLCKYSSSGRDFP